MNLTDVAESAYMAIDTVRTNKLRSALTILGVSVGVVTVMFMVSIIQGLNKAFAQQIESLGSNTIWVLKFDPSFGRQPTSEELHRKELTVEDADAIRNDAPSISGVAPFYRKIAETVSYKDKQSDLVRSLDRVARFQRGQSWGRSLLRSQNMASARRLSQEDAR